MKNNLSKSFNLKVLNELEQNHGINKQDITELTNKHLDGDSSVISLLLNTTKLDINKLNEISNSLYGLDTISINNIDHALIPIKHTNEELLDKYEAAPVLIKSGNLYIAINNPHDFTSLSTYQFNTGLNTQAVLMSEQDIKKLKKIIKTKLTSADLSSINSGLDEDNENPIVSYVNKIIDEAIKKDASDIHFEPYKTELRIRFRFDGMLTEIAKLPIDSLNQLNSRLKVLSNLDISEKRKPQDGRFNLVYNNRNYDFRISTCPTMFGEKIVIRILDPYKAQLGIDQLGYEPEQKELFLKTLNKLQGIILVTGPTGSGKTISLYTALNILNTDTRNISTAEDPIEIYLPGINQVQVNSKIGLDFASALRCFLRQDPDIMMVGEIRDLETAEIAIKAAQTGHLVLSTLHTNGAAETLNRLSNMGLPSYNIATTISMVIAQRLIRRLCTKCRVSDDIPNEILINERFPKELINTETKIYKNNPAGCDHCNNGFKGRVGVYEAMPISKEMEQIILNNGSAIDIKKQAIKENILSLRQAGLRKVLAGITSLSEVNRVTKNA